MDESALLTDLTDAQREAVCHGEGPLLVLAAAGSGKTRVITRRIARLVETGAAAPWEILALTFTNKAAGEMRERVLELLGPGGRRVRGLVVTTFHSLGARLLRRWGPEGGVPGLKPDFAIYDTADQLALVKRGITDLGLSTSNWSPRSVHAAISAAKNDLLDAAGFAGRATDFRSRTVAQIFEKYEQSMRAAGAVDFDDLLLLTARLLRGCDEAREACRSRWRHLLVDEYQDTNHAQFVIASLLAGRGEDEAGGSGPNVCVVGDPDQSIYGWRGADISNILEFEEHYPSARVIALGENFRSTTPILSAADTLIGHNAMRKPKPLYTTSEGGEPVRVVQCLDERDESELIAEWFEGLNQGQGLQWREMAVLYRTNALSRAMEDALRNRTIPYVIARGTAFYQREEVKHALAYLRLIANPSDDVSLDRIVNVPTRGVGKTSLARVRDHAAQRGLPMLEAMRQVSRVDGLTARSAKAMAGFVELLDSWRGSGTFLGAEPAAEQGALATLVERVVIDSGLEAMYTKRASSTGLEADEERVANLGELITSARRFEEEYEVDADPASEAPLDGDEPEQPALLPMLRAFLESVALVADADTVDPERGAVTLMTLHAAKGLEFPAVAIIGLEEGGLPHARAFEAQAELEEERRLCFVGITRAMRWLTITSARYRTVRGVTERQIASRFLHEIGDEHVTREDRASDPTRDPLGDDYTGGGGEGGPRGRGAAPGVTQGATVRHPRFGVGQVLALDGDRARIRFYDVGIKTIVLGYAPVTPVNKPAPF